jgi:hypothetical protein
MKLFSVRGFSALLLATSGALAAIAACSSNNNVPVAGAPDAAGNLQDSTTSNTSDATGPGMDDGGGGITSDALVTYDGPPPNVDGGQLSCATPDGLSIKFNPIYSGFDGVHMYQVPVFVSGGDGGNIDPGSVTWGSSDPTMVALAPYVRGIMITTKKSGDVTIVAQAGSTCGSAPLHIAAYTPDQWNTGNDRYNNSMALMINPEAGIPADATIPKFDGAPPFDASSFDAEVFCQRVAEAGIAIFGNTTPACTNCHGAGSTGKLFGMTLFMDIAHTPEQIGGFSEDELTNVFVHGVIPDGGTFDTTITPYCIWHQLHEWTDIDTPDKQAGMRAYLRSLTPQEQTGCFELFNANLCADGGQ